MTEEELYYHLFWTTIEPVIYIVRLRISHRMTADYVIGILYRSVEYDLLPVSSAPALAVLHQYRTLSLRQDIEMWISQLEPTEVCELAAELAAVSTRPLDLITYINAIPLCIRENGLTRQQDRYKRAKRPRIDLTNKDDIV